MAGDGTVEKSPYASYTVFFLMPPLPPYWPEINPDEYLNRKFKTVLRSSDRAPRKKALLQKDTSFMDYL